MRRKKRVFDVSSVNSQQYITLEGPNDFCVSLVSKGDEVEIVVEQLGLSTASNTTGFCTCPSRRLQTMLRLTRFRLIDTTIMVLVTREKTLDVRVF